MAIIAAWLIAALVAVGSFALVYRMMDERTRELRTMVVALRAEIVKKDEYIDIFRGEMIDLNGELRHAQGTFSAKLSEAKLNREIENIEHPPQTPPTKHSRQ